MITFYVVSFILIYTGLSLWWFLSVMGYKYRKGKWWDPIIGFPVYIIAFFIGLKWYFKRK